MSHKRRIEEYWRKNHENSDNIIEQKKVEEKNSEKIEKSQLLQNVIQRIIDKSTDWEPMNALIVKDIERTEKIEYIYKTWSFMIKAYNNTPGLFEDLERIQANIQNDIDYILSMIKYRIEFQESELNNLHYYVKEEFSTDEIKRTIDKQQNFVFELKDNSEFWFKGSIWIKRNFYTSELIPPMVRLRFTYNPRFSVSK